MRVIAIAIRKAASAKPATAVNLAAAIRIHDRTRVLLIDLDAQANATTWLTGLEGSPGHSICDVIMQQASLRSCVLEMPSRIDLVPSNLKTANLDVELLGVLHFHSRLASAIDHVGEGRYDYVILDCPPNLSMNTLNAFGASNVVAIPVQLKREAFDAVSHPDEYAAQGYKWHLGSRNGW